MNDGLKRPPDYHRAVALSALTERGSADLVVVGGGIHGACLAHLAARDGIDTILLESNDFASGTSSRSTKLAHGGLRYLEVFDFEQVKEGIRAREELFESAGHLVRPARFLIPVRAGDWWGRIKYGLGLTFYDRFLKNPQYKHSWRQPEATGWSRYSAQELQGSFEYCDGLIADTRLVLEHVLAALANRCRVLNYAKVVSVEQRNKEALVRWQNQRTGGTHEIQARVVCNCTGPWVHGLSPEPAALPRVKYSRGIHLLFNLPWSGPCLFMPMGKNSRYYFLLPHHFGTLVGTTEREVTEAEQDPQPRQDEIEELLGLLNRDVPRLGLDRSKLHYAFCGIRTLPLRGTRKDVSRLSRKHVWYRQGQVLTLIGGKYTTAVWTAREGYKEVCRLLGVESPSTSPLEYPSYLPAPEAQRYALELSRRYTIESRLTQRAVQRYGSRLRRVPEEFFRPIANQCIAAEIWLAVEREMALTVEDLMRRRLELEYAPGHGLEALAEIRRVWESLGSVWEAKEEAMYRERLAKLSELLKG